MGAVTVLAQLHALGGRQLVARTVLLAGRLGRGEQQRLDVELHGASSGDPVLPQKLPTMYIPSSIQTE